MHIRKLQFSKWVKPLFIYDVIVNTKWMPWTFLQILVLIWLLKLEHQSHVKHCELGRVNTEVPPYPWSHSHSFNYLQSTTVQTFSVDNSTNKQFICFIISCASFWIAGWNISPSVLAMSGLWITHLSSTSILYTLTTH